MTNKTALLILIGLTIALRIPGIFWGEIYKKDYAVLETDEKHHIDICLNFLDDLDKDLLPEYSKRGEINARGFGIQMGIISYPIIKIFKTDPTQTIFIVGRCLSVLYSVLVVLLIYRIAFYFLQNRVAAYLSAILLSVFDLNVTYSHYCIPEMAHIFWAYFSVFTSIKIYKYLRKDSKVNYRFYLVLLGLSASIAFSIALKLDFIPLAIFMILIFVLYLQKKLSFTGSFKLAFIFFMFLASSFLVCTAFNYGPAGIINSYKILSFLNLNTIEVDNHFLYNPLLYICAVTGGTSILFLVVFVKFLLPMYNGIQRDKKTGIYIFTSYIILEFVILYIMDATTIRRANILLPFFALVGGFGLNHIWNSNMNTIKPQIIVAFIVLYTLTNTIISQLNFIYDTRYKAREYLLSDSDNSLSYKYYLYNNVSGMPQNLSKPEENADIILLHEGYYQKYWKSFTTPFKTPKCCEEVYFCEDKNECIYVQEILRNNSNYRLKKKFTTIDFFPEKYLFKKVFGTYEEFIGDVLIYEKIK